MSRVLGIVLILLAFLLPVEARLLSLDSSDAELDGSVVDDGRPASGSLSAQWSLVSGPGTVVFSEVQNPFPTAHAHAAFSQTGDYVLRLTASDSDRSASADITVTVSDIHGGNQPPVALAGSDASAITLRPLALAGFATDDGLPSGTLLTTWSRSAGRSGGVRFDDASQTNTTATFTLPGVYTPRLSAQDGRLCDICQLFRCDPIAFHNR